MSRKQGDLCPHCKEGHLTVHPDREIREDKLGTASHKTWLCDKCGKTCKDFERGVTEAIVTSEHVVAKIQKEESRKGWFSRFRKK